MICEMCRKIIKFRDCTFELKGNIKIVEIPSMYENLIKKDFQKDIKLTICERCFDKYFIARGELNND